MPWYHRYYQKYMRENMNFCYYTPQKSILLCIIDMRTNCLLSSQLFTFFQYNRFLDINMFRWFVQLSQVSPTLFFSIVRAFRDEATPGESPRSISNECPTTHLGRGPWCSGILYRIPACPAWSDSFFPGLDLFILTVRDGMQRTFAVPYLISNTFIVL